MNVDGIQSYQQDDDWIVVRNVQSFGKLHDGHEILSFESWTGDRWTWQTNLAKGFDSQENADFYIGENHERLLGAKLV